MTEGAADHELWRDFDPDWYLNAYKEVGDILRASPFRRIEDVYAEFARTMRHSPNPWFRETWYRNRYEPVNAEIENGFLQSGFEHYCASGHPHLSPHWLFDPHCYRERFARKHGRAFDPAVDGDVYDHFLRIGQYEGLSGHPMFDPGYYADMAPFDVAARIRVEGPFTTFLKHISCGGAEPAVSPLFDPAWYLARYPGFADAIANRRWDCALHHYLANPDPDLIDPSQRFSERAYLSCHHGVAQAVRDGMLRNGFEHFCRHGRAEGRFYEPAEVSTETVAAAPAGDFPLLIRAFDTVTFLPMRQDPGTAAGFSFGVLDSLGQPFGAFEHPWCDMRALDAAPGYRPGSFLYGGSLPNHFGHFLVDGLTRIWSMRDKPDLPVLWHLDPSIPDPFPSWIDEIWRLLGLDQHTNIFIRSAITVDRVFLPDSGRRTIHALHPSHVAALAVYDGPESPDGDRIWLSRSALPEGLGRVEREGELEAALVAEGWTIVRPEALSVAKQAGLYESARIVAGFIGSAFHAVLLAKTPKARLLLIDRPGIAHENYDAVARSRGLQQAFLAADYEAYEYEGLGLDFTVSNPKGLAERVLERSSRTDW